MSKFCSNCGAKLQEDSLFCEECGTKVVREASAAGDAYEPEEAEDAFSPYKEDDEKPAGRPIGIIIGCALVLIAVAGAFVLFGGKGKPGSHIDNSPKPETVADMHDPKEDFIISIDQTKAEQQESFVFPEETEFISEETEFVPEETKFPDNEDNIPQGFEGLEGNAGYPIVTGGEWEQADEIRFYIKDDQIVTGSWIAENGKLYFVDDRGYMLTDCYTPDGYYVGPDGVYDSDADYGIVDIGGSSADEIAERLSTSDIAKATDFEWLLDYIINDGSGAGRVITDPDCSGRVMDSSALNGGWKAFMFTDSGVYGSDVERYFNVEITTNGSFFDIIVNWKYFFDPSSGSSVDETHTDVFEGSYTDGFASAQSAYARMDLEEFYLSNDGNAEYAVGTVYWISGETDRIGLMRNAR